MVRKLLLFAGALALAAPMVHSQSINVCVFQMQKGHKVADGSDATGVANALSEIRQPGEARINAIPIQGVPPKGEDAEAGKRGCSFAVDLWRSDVPASTPMAAAASASPVSSGTAGVYPTDAGSQNSTVLEYSLRRTNPAKKIAHGEEDNANPWTSLADTIAKKIAKAS